MDRNPIVDLKCKRTSKKWTVAKSFADSPVPQLLELSKLSIAVSLITGRGRSGFNKYLNVIGTRDAPDCEKCGEEANFDHLNFHEVVFFKIFKRLVF